MNAKIHHFDSTVRAYDATQSDDKIKKGDVLIIESEKVVGLADTWPVAVTEWPGELHDLAPGATLESLGFSDKSIALANDAARSLGFPLFVIEDGDDTVPHVPTLGSIDVDDCRKLLELLNNTLEAKRIAEVKAWDSLGRYKFEMFGYWASAWVKYNQLLPRAQRSGNPFKRAVALAREVRDESES